MINLDLCILRFRIGPELQAGGIARRLNMTDQWRVGSIFQARCVELAAMNLVVGTWQLMSNLATAPDTTWQTVLGAQGAVSDKFTGIDDTQNLSIKMVNPQSNNSRFSTMTVQSHGVLKSPQSPHIFNGLMILQGTLS